MKDGGKFLEIQNSGLNSFDEKLDAQILKIF